MVDATEIAVYRCINPLIRRVPEMSELSGEVARLSQSHAVDSRRGPWVASRRVRSSAGKGMRFRLRGKAASKCCILTCEGVGQSPHT